MKVLENELTPITRDDSTTISRDEFNEYYGFPSIPVVFTHAFQHLPVKDKWSPSYLANALTDMHLLESPADQTEKVLMTLSEYMAAPSSRHYYKTSAHLNGDLSNDYETPEMFNCWYASTKIGTPRQRLSWLYVGAEGTYSDTHRDVWWSSAWNYLIRGRKLWLIYPAAYNQGISSTMDQYSISNKINDPVRILQQTYRPMVCVQEAGELIYVPGNCYHAVYNLEDTISLTENYINETNYDLVKSYFKQGSNTKNMRLIDAIVKEGFEQLRANEKKVPYENKG